MSGHPEMTARPGRIERSPTSIASSLAGLACALVLEACSCGASVSPATVPPEDAAALVRATAALVAADPTAVQLLAADERKRVLFVDGATICTMRSAGAGSTGADSAISCWSLPEDDAGPGDAPATIRSSTARRQMTSPFVVGGAVRTQILGHEVRQARLTDDGASLDGEALASAPVPPIATALRDVTIDTSVLVALEPARDRLHGSGTLYVVSTDHGASLCVVDDGAWACSEPIAGEIAADRAARGAIEWGNGTRVDAQEGPAWLAARRDRYDSQSHDHDVGYSVFRRVGDALVLVGYLPAGGTHGGRDARFDAVPAGPDCIELVASSGGGTSDGLERAPSRYDGRDDRGPQVLDWRGTWRILGDGGFERVERCQ